MKLVLYIVDLFAFWSAYNFLHILKLKYINKLLGISNTNEYFNRLVSDYNTSREKKENIINLVFYFIVIIMCLFVYNNYKN
jgi:hypothetical protein